MAVLIHREGLLADPKVQNALRLWREAHADWEHRKTLSRAVTRDSYRREFFMVVGAHVLDLDPQRCVPGDLE